MNVVVHITYLVEGVKVLQRGSFPSRRRTPEQVALDWWKQLKRESFLELELVKVLIDGEDKTDTLKKYLYS